MKWKALIAVLIIVALLGGFIGIPAARAEIVTGWKAALILTKGSPGTGMVQFMLTSNTGSWASSDVTFVSSSIVKSGPAVSGGYTFTGSSGAEWDMGSGQDLPVGTYTIEYSVESSVGWMRGSLTLDYEGVDTSVYYPVSDYVPFMSAPMSVSITGPNTSSIGVNTSFAAVIVNGTAPYSTTWHVDCMGGGGGPVLLTADNVSSAGLTLKFTDILHYVVRCTVVDATGGMATATHDVNLMSSKPVVHGQIVRSEAAESYKFSMYQDGAVIIEGVAADSECIPSAQYDVTSPTVIMQSEYGYQIWPVSPLPNPLYVYVTWHVPDTGEVWSYRFTLDTSILTGEGTWTKSDGTGSDDGGTLAPTWLDMVVNRFKSVLKDIGTWFLEIFKVAFKALFVPTPEQMAVLMPKGTVQADGTLAVEGNLAASLLEGTTWGAGASVWKMTVHYSGMAITLVDIDFTAMRSSAFVRGIRLAIQGVMSMSLIYLIVVLI